MSCSKPKFHKLEAHLQFYIQQFDVILNGSTQVIERIHKLAVKHMFKNSSCKESNIIDKFNTKVKHDSMSLIS